MEHAADTAEAAAVDHYFSSSTVNVFAPVCHSATLPTDTGKTDDCFVIALGLEGAIQMTQSQLQFTCSYCSREELPVDARIYI